MQGEVLLVHSRRQSFLLFCQPVPPDLSFGDLLCLCFLIANPAGTRATYCARIALECPTTEDILRLGCTMTSLDRIARRIKPAGFVLHLLLDSLLSCCWLYKVRFSFRLDLCPYNVFHKRRVLFRVFRTLCC